MAQKRFRAESKIQKNKKTAIRLLFSLIVLLSVYFASIRTGLQIVQEIYIWVSVVLVAVYAVCAFRIMYIREKSGDSKSKEVTDALHMLDDVRKSILLVLIPLILALLIDYMLIVLGLAEYIGI